MGHRPNVISSRRAAIIAAAVITAQAALPALAQAPGEPNTTIVVRRYHPSQFSRINRSSFVKTCPERRGFMAPILNNAEAAWPMTAPTVKGTPDYILRAADVVSRHLARDGLPLTLAEAMDTAGVHQMPQDAAQRTETLRMMGVPVDLLACFEVPAQSGDGERMPLDAFILKRLRDGAGLQTLKNELSSLPFRFPKTRADFALATEEGTDAINTIRLQLPGADWATGPGDGSAIDIARQLITAIPTADFVVSIDESQVAALRKEADAWPLTKPRQLIVLAEPYSVEQWAQDNGKPGFVDGPDGQRLIATITPRYASVGEELTKFVPHESFVMDSLASTGHAVVHSPLIFQGGNLMAVHDPTTNRRVLLIGEAEVYRNTALGLSQAQVLEAFRVEFAVDECAVLPAVSFHIDFEISPRVIDGRVVAFVNDSIAASRIVLRLGVEALRRSGQFDAATTNAILRQFAAGSDTNALAILAPSVLRLASTNRRFSEDVCRGFKASDTDDAAANFERFLLALDILAAHFTSPQDMPPHRVFGAYVRSFQRREADRQLLIDKLASLGWRIVRVPSLADETRSLNYVNGVQLPDAYLMPAFGGFYAPLDAEATRAIESAMGEYGRVTPIYTAESQRRLGALHCSVAVYPEPLNATGIPSQSPARTAPN